MMVSIERCILDVNTYIFVMVKTGRRYLNNLCLRSFTIDLYGDDDDDEYAL